MSEDPAERSFVIRSFGPGDQAQCQRLYVEGLIGGKIAENDTGFDIDHIGSAYMGTPASHFWVAEAPAREGEPAGEEGQSASLSTAQVVGMVGVQQHDPGTGEIRRLRVAQSHRRRGIGSALLETALKFCEERQYLKITLDTYMEREPAVHLFQKFRFRHDRTRRIGGKELLYFYLDLYRGEEAAK